MLAPLPPPLHCVPGCPLSCFSSSNLSGASQPRCRLQAGLVSPGSGFLRKLSYFRSRLQPGNEEAAMKIYIFKLDGFFFFFPPYFVAGSEWFVGAWGGRASAGGRPRLGGSVGMWMQWDVSQRPRGWKPKQWTRPGGAARLSARWLVCLILVGLFLSQNWIIQSLFGRQSSAFRGCTCGNAHLLPSQREGFQVPRSNVGPLLTLTWDSLKLTSWGLKASKCAFIFMEDVWLTP